MSRVVIKNGELELFKKIMKDGFAVENGKETYRVIRELKRAGVQIHHGYAQDTKKVIVALESPLKIVGRRRGFARTVFDLK